METSSKASVATVCTGHRNSESTDTSSMVRFAIPRRRPYPQRLRTPRRRRLTLRISAGGFLLSLSSHCTFFSIILSVSLKLTTVSHTDRAQEPPTHRRTPTPASSSLTPHSVPDADADFRVRPPHPRRRTIALCQQRCPSALPTTTPHHASTAAHEQIEQRGQECREGWEGARERRCVGNRARRGYTPRRL